MPTAVEKDKTMNYKTYGTVIWEDDNLNLQVNEWQGRLFLVDSETGEKLNELINGHDSLTKYYKGKIIQWVKDAVTKAYKARLKEQAYHLNHASKQQALAEYYKELMAALETY
jgi:hypothetical protein